MNSEINKYLEDIIDSIKNINIHLGPKKDFSYYKSNITVKRAFERGLEIIGEAVNRILKINSDFPITQGRIIVNLRNRVIHSYDSVDDNLLWRIIIKDIPIIQAEAERLINNN